LYVIRKRLERAVDALPIPDHARQRSHIVSLSCNTLIYKGMLTAGQIETMFPDLTDPDVESALALVHQRFSTNTFPSWPLAHPYRYIAHNGEINTLTGNINWMRAREGLLRSDVLGDDLQKVLPVIREGGSDTATFDNVLDVPPEDIIIKERVNPGRIFLVDTARGRIVQDEEIKRELAGAHPYGEWLAHLIDIEDLPPAPHLPPPSHETVRRRQQLFGYT